MKIAGARRGRFGMVRSDLYAESSASRLCVLVINTLLDGGGIDSHTLSLCQALHLQGCVVTLAVPCTARWIAAAQGIPGISVLALRAPCIFWPAILSRYMRQQQMHIIHAHHRRDYWVAILASLLSGRKRVGRAVVTAR
uniref:glycosyltransferase n=1 Tax=Cupriavidus ulmosensis TaxID=3065913 RepID=UPI003F84C042